MEVYGHTLIVPKFHCEDIYAAPDEVLAAVAKCGKELAVVYRAKIGATGVNLLHASGMDGEQSVFHFHTHLLPRFAGDGLSTWPRLPERQFDHDEFLGRLIAG